MTDQENLTVREIEERDIELIADYWLNANDDFLITLGVDLDKLPSREQIEVMLLAQVHAPIKEKKSYALIWLIDGVPCGHCNVNEIIFGEEAFMHIHLWNSKKRQKGFGPEFIKLSIPYFFENLDLKRIICEPYALNEAPNKVMEKIGFEFVKEHVCVPGSLSFKQKVKRWVMTKERYQGISELSNS